MSRGAQMRTHVSRAGTMQTPHARAARDAHEMCEVACALTKTKKSRIHETLLRT